MTAGQISTPYRQVRTSLLVAALAVTFGSGLLTGLLAPRTVGQGAQAASKAEVVAAPAGGSTLAAVATNPERLAELQAAAIGGGGLGVNQVAPNAAIAAPAGGSLAAVATNPERLAELQAAAIGGGGLEIGANSPSGR